MKNKKIIIIISSIVILVVGLIIILEKTNKINIFNSVKTKEYESTLLKLVDYENENFKMQIPKKWKVDTAGTDMFYAIRVYDENKPNYQIFAILKAQPFLKSEKAKKWHESYYNLTKNEQMRVLSEAVVLSKPTVEDFYSIFNEYTKYAKNIEPTYNNFTFPDLKNFACIESFESNTSLKSISKDDKTIRGSFQNSNNTVGEGLFMASIVDFGKDMTLGFDTLYYMAYNIMGISTDEYDFINYKEILTKSLNSLEYKESFVNTTIKNGNEQTQNTLSINKSMNEAYESYNNAWTNRQKTYDITSQKTSDATLGYERVYDTETNEIYKAYNGFTDDYKGDKYKPVTDDMYTEKVTGYIEK